MDIFLGTLFGIVCLLLIAVILLQRGRGGGLGAAFGGGGGSSAFGTRTGDVFTWVTIVLTVSFLLLAIGAVLAHQQDPDRVATPEFSPAPGPIEEPVFVTISSRTPGARIWYTLNGEDPEREISMQYERDPVEVHPGTTLRARAFRAGWADSEVAVGTYADATAPEPEPAEEPDPPEVTDPEPIEELPPVDQPDEQPEPVDEPEPADEPDDEPTDDVEPVDEPDDDADAEQDARPDES